MSGLRKIFKMSNEPKEQAFNPALIIRHGRVESVDIYEIKDSELDLLEGGSPANLQLNFAIFLLSLAFSSICALCTSTFTNKTIETIFLVVSVVGLLLGAFLLISWAKSLVSIKALCKRIRERIPIDKPMQTNIAKIPKEPLPDEDEQSKPLG